MPLSLLTYSKRLPALKRLPVLIAAALLTVVHGTPALANSVTASGLSVTSGGLTFSNFTCDFVESGNATGGCYSTNVSTLAAQPPNLKFLTNLSISGASSATAALTFTLLDPDGLDAIGLSIDSTFMGLGVDSVTEFVYASQGGPLVGDASILCSDTTGCPSSTSVNVPLNGTYTNLYITNGITLSSYEAKDSASISAIRETFTNSPEPTSIALVGAFLLLGVFLKPLSSDRT